MSLQCQNKNTGRVYVMVADVVDRGFQRAILITVYDCFHYNEVDNNYLQVWGPACMYQERLVVRV